MFHFSAWKRAQSVKPCFIFSRYGLLFFLFVLFFVCLFFFCSCGALISLARWLFSKTVITLKSVCPNVSLSWWWKRQTHQHTGAPIRRCIYNLELSITVTQQGFRAMSRVCACVCVFTESLIKKDQLLLRVCECLWVLENQVPLSHCHWLLVLTFGMFGCTDWRWRGFRLQGHPCHLCWNTLNYMGSVWSGWHSLHLKRECILPPMWIIYNMDPEKAKACLTKTAKSKYNQPLDSNVLKTKLLLNDAHSVGALWLLGPADWSHMKMCPFYCKIRQ